tara:strand:+ start:94 stop:318 length:225 start_codon:yes stop_codon:yes gene_type:complete
MAKKNFIDFKAEVVKGICPTCEELTVLIGIADDFYRCLSCGADLEQYINGRIRYLPVIHSTKKGTKPFVKAWKE